MWRNRDRFVAGRAEITEFLRDKWDRGPRAAQDLWAFEGDRIAVRFQYECRDVDGRWWRSSGNGPGSTRGSMRRREASINDVPIEESERRIHGRRPDAERGGAEQPLR